MKSAAEPVTFAVLFGFVMLLAVFVEPVVARDGAVRVLGLGRSFGLFATAMSAMTALDEGRMRLVPVTPFDWNAVLIAVGLMIFCHLVGLLL